MRDNKQTGPYTVEELAAHGLKAYDLVWLEGKSAAWRYPSEIAELKPFAPVVEEQPFDRFYKKPEIKTFESSAKDNTRVQPGSSIYDQPKKTDENTPSKQYVQVSSGSKKIHVSLPGAKPVASGNTATSKEELRKSEPTRVSPTAVPVSQNVSNEAVSHNSSSKEQAQKELSSVEQPNRKSKFLNIKTKEKVGNIPPAGDAPVSKLLFRTVAAACLLLGGALIGLIINYNSQQKKFQQLNQLVQEIKQQDDPGTSGTVKNDKLSDEAVLPKSDAKEPEPPAAEPEYKEDIQLPPVKKDRRGTRLVKGTADTTHTQVIPEVVPTIVEEENASTKMDKVATELAKKNLWQLVSVNHNPYKTGVFGGISNLSLKLSNKSLLQLDHVEVEVLFFSPEEKTVNKQKVVFENVSPGEQLTIDVPKSNRGVKVEYSIKKISTKEFELAHTGM